MKRGASQGAKMKLLSAFLALILLTSCSLSTPTPSIRAAYLVEGEGQLSQVDLDKHPEILVTHNFDDFKNAARDRIGLWIDKNAVQLVETGWLDKMPQAAYPIILVGYNDPLRSFKYSLTVCCFLGPSDPDFSQSEPGFSVIERPTGEPGTPDVIVQGFKQISTVADVLKVSNDLLDGKSIPTASTPPNVPVQTATP
jgi:hypothetical protein